MVDGHLRELVDALVGVVATYTTAEDTQPPWIVELCTELNAVGIAIDVR